jgi:hypothetical protein
MTPDSRIPDRVDSAPRSVFLILAIVAALLIGCQSLSPTRGGAQPDSTSPLQAQFDALAPGGHLTLEPRTYKHSGVIIVRVPNAQIDGNGATLEATDDKTSGVRIIADGVQISNLTFKAPTEGPRYSGLDQHKVLITGKHDSLTDVNVVGSAAAGVFISGAVDFKLENVTVSGTRADGIHITGGSSAGRLDNVRADQTGDDAVAVVSYQNEPVPCSDIQITNVDVASTRWGRGIAVVGGRNVTVRGFTVANTSSAGLYVAAEGDPYYTQSVEQVDISGGSLTAANTSSDVTQGAVQLYSGNAGKTVQGVRISDVGIIGTPASAGRDVALVLDGGSMSDISLKNIHLSGTEVTPFDSNAPTGSFNTSGWTQDSTPISVS